MSPSLSLEEFSVSALPGSQVAVSGNWRGLFCGCLAIRALLFVVYIRSLIFGNSQVDAYCNHS